nr:MAG TPA: hypothetical protein [Caudoviricetes sp.]
MLHRYVLSLCFIAMCYHYSLSFCPPYFTVGAPVHYKSFTFILQERCRILDFFNNFLPFFTVKW